MDNALNDQIDFLIAADRLKQVERKCSIIGGSRRENSAEHSWHLMLMAMTLQSYAAEPVDLGRVLQMLALHDLGEIEQGDTIFFDQTAAITASERIGFQKLCAALPKAQQEHFLALWDEFAAQQTPEAKFAAALDRLVPVFHNYYNRGGSWLEFNISLRQVLERVRPAARAVPAIGDYVEELLRDAAAKGYFASEEPLLV